MIEAEIMLLCRVSPFATGWRESALGAAQQIMLDLRRECRPAHSAKWSATLLIPASSSPVQSRWQLLVPALLQAYDGFREQERRATKCLLVVRADKLLLALSRKLEAT